MSSTTGQQGHSENAEQLGGANFDATKSACVSAFGVACDPDAYEESRMSHQKAEDLTIAEQGCMVRAGNLDPSQVTSCKAFANVAQKRGDNAKAESKAKASADALFLALIDQIRDLEASIASLEDSFHDKYGDAWREEFALIVLDEVPPRELNESIDDYRQRLEGELIDEMIDTNTGLIKDEYKNHPNEDVRRAAKWAKQEYDINKIAEKAQEYTEIAQNTSNPKEAIAVLVEEADYLALTRSGKDASISGAPEHGTLDTAVNEKTDTSADMDFGGMV